MIGLDTNVLVRYLTQDDPKQAVVATQLIENSLTASKPGFVSLIVLTELYWVLTTLYKVTDIEWLDTVNDLLASPSMNIEGREAVQNASQLCRSSKAGFIDALISQTAKSAGCELTVSFDKVAIKLAGMHAI